jgi:dipeptidase
MGSDMVVALCRATVDGHTLFGHNLNRPQGEGQSLVRVPGREFAPGEKIDTTHTRVPQVRHTLTALAAHADGQWGYLGGLNEKGVAVGLTTIHTRLVSEQAGLTGPDLVRLALERAGTARQAVDVLTDLISRHGQGPSPGAPDEPDGSFLIADGAEAYALEACGAHWVLQTVGQIRAASGMCHLRQDWDRISRGLSDLAIARGWWPPDGSKLDFAEALGRAGDTSAALRRWGRATVRLEQRSGEIDDQVMRQLLHDVALPAGSFASRESGNLARPVQTACGLLAQISPHPDELSLLWAAFGPPGASVYFPLCAAGELPAAFTDPTGAGSPLWRRMTQWQEEGRQDARLRHQFRTALANLQSRFDQTAHEFLAEANLLQKRGAQDELRRLATSFMQHNVECWERAEADLSPQHLGKPHLTAPPRAESELEWIAG